MPQSFSIHDDRPFIHDLLKEYKSEIEAVRQNLKNDSLFQANTSLYDDDIWILRYLISHKKRIPNATKAALATMKFREEHDLNSYRGDDIQKMIPNLNQSKEDIPSSYYGIKDNMKSGDAIVTSQPDDDRCVLTIYTMRHLSLKNIDKETTDEHMRHNNLMNKEAIYQIMDRVTRKTGRLTRQMKILDLKGFQLKDVSVSYLKRDGKASKAVEDFYPQLLGTTYVVNAPSWIGQVWNTIRPLFPKRFVEKVHIFGKKEDKSKIVKKLSRYISEQDLPQRYGGKNKVWPLPHISATLQNE